MINHSTKIQNTKILPLRWIGNICGLFAGNHIFKALILEEKDDIGLRHKYHGLMWKYLNKPYTWWGTYYTVDMAAWKEELTDSES
jgi:hypothetical protein